MMEDTTHDGGQDPCPSWWQSEIFHYLPPFSLNFQKWKHFSKNDIALLLPNNMATMMSSTQWQFPVAMVTICIRYNSYALELSIIVTKKW